MNRRENEIGKGVGPRDLVCFDFHFHAWLSGVSRLLIQLSSCFFATAVLAASEIDESKLPLPASAKVDFERDIQPLLEAKCWRCHGPDRPKSHFRLDRRESALKGGDNGIDIIPGNSQKSPLVHYIARLVPDMEMPPPGKGEPLTVQEVGLMRAWIDQGLLWNGTNALVPLAFSITPMLRGVAVSGNRANFREIEGITPGFGGGVEHFELEEHLSPDKTFSAEGRALFPENDFQIKLALQKTDVGFVRGGFEQWRRYYDDTGGYYRPFAIPSFDLNRDLHLDIGRVWIDFGLTLPNMPTVILGYEYQYKQGDKSMLTWGPVGDKNIYPSAKNIDEHAHIAKFDLTYDFSGWHLEDNARVEIYSQKTVTSDLIGPNTLEENRQGATHVQGMNAFRMERQITESWLLSGGYLYSRFEGDASFSITTLDAAGVPTIGNFWSSDVLLLKREAHVFSLASLFQPIEGLSVSLGFQSEWQRQHGVGNIRLDEGNPNVPEDFHLLPAALRSDLDKSLTMENVGLRYTKIPFTVLFAEARFEQEAIGQFEQEDTGSIAGSPHAADAFLRNTDATNDRRDGRIGFNTSPWRWFALSAHYKNRSSDTDYDHLLDLRGDPNTAILTTNNAYSAFIRHRKIDTDEVQTKLALRPANWLRATITYQRIASDYSTTTDPVPGGTVPESLIAGTQQENRYGFGLTVTPFQRFYFSGTFTYSDSRTVTGQYGSVVPYKGDVYSVLASANYTLDAATAFHCAYSFSDADYGQNNFEGLPIGLTYTRHGVLAGISRRLTANLTSTLRYGFYRYLEPTSGGVNDYTAHGIFATMVVKWP